MSTAASKATSATAQASASIMFQDKGIMLKRASIHSMVNGGSAPKLRLALLVGEKLIHARSSMQASAVQQFIAADRIVPTV